MTQINRRSSNLVIEAVIDKDAGEYECRVSNRGGISRVKTDLVVKGTSVCHFFEFNDFNEIKLLPYRKKLDTGWKWAYKTVTDTFYSFK